MLKVTNSFVPHISIWYTFNEGRAYYCQLEQDKFGIPELIFDCFYLFWLIAASSVNCGIMGNGRGSSQLLICGYKFMQQICIEMQSIYWMGHSSALNISWENVSVKESSLNISRAIWAKSRRKMVHVICDKQCADQSARMTQTDQHQCRSLVV